MGGADDARPAKSSSDHLDATSRTFSSAQRLLCAGSSTFNVCLDCSLSSARGGVNVCRSSEVEVMSAHDGGRTQEEAAPVAVAQDQFAQAGQDRQGYRSWRWRATRRQGGGRLLDATR